MSELKVIIHDAEEGGYWAEVQGMPGCYSQGETLAEVRSNIRDAAEGWIEAKIALALRAPVRDHSVRTARSHVRIPRKAHA